MNNREIITLMHKLFSGDIDTSDGYVHLFTNDELDISKYEAFVSSYIHGEAVLVFINSQNVHQCTIHESFELVRDNMANNRIRLANENFSAKILIESIGVGVGNLTSAINRT
jgi:hypothetical protein